MTLLLLQSGPGMAGAAGPAVPAYVTWDAATATTVTVSGGNLVVTSVGTGGGQGVRVATSAGKTTGKHYFEVTITTRGTPGTSTGMGVGTPASTYVGMEDAITGATFLINAGSIRSNGSTVTTAPATPAAGAVIGLAIDLDNRKFWQRTSPSGFWNSSTNIGDNPATNTGGITIPAGTMVPLCVFNGDANVFTANFGASAFVGAVPSGFTAGWTA